MLLPQEIRKKEFSLAMGGYARSEVNSYLEYIADNYEKLRRENDELSRRLDAAIEKLDQYNSAELAAVTANVKAGDALSGEKSTAAAAILSGAVSSLRLELDMVSAKLKEIELLVSDAEPIEEDEPIEEIEADELDELDAIEDETDDIEALDGIDAEAETAEVEAEESLIFEIPVVSEIDEAEEAEETDEAIEETVEEVVEETESVENDVVFDVPAEEADADEQTLPEQLDMDDFLADFFDVDGEVTDADAEAETSIPDAVPSEAQEPKLAEEVQTEKPVDQPKKASKVRFHLAKKKKKAAPEKKETDDLDDILSALKLQYDSVSESEEADDDDFDMTNLDEFNYIFGDSSTKIDTVATDDDIVSDLYDD